MIDVETGDEESGGVGVGWGGGVLGTQELSLATPLSMQNAKNGVVFKG